MSDEATPGELELVRQFVNTADLEAGTDELASPAELRAWLAARFSDSGEVDVAGLRRALALREAVRGLALANGGGPTYPLDLATLNRAAAECRLQPRFGRGGSVRLEPGVEGLDGSLGRLVAIVYEAMATGTWDRFKVCGRHSCRWAYWDGSRNQSRTWCSMATCGNRAKAQRFRARASHPEE